MAARFKNTDVEVFLPVGQHGHETSTSRRVNIQPAAATIAFEQFGVEISDGYILFDDVEGAACYVEHGRVQVGTDLYAIMAPPRAWNTLPLTSHVQVLLQKIRNQEALPT